MCDNGCVLLSRVTVNILSQQYQTANKGWSFSLDVGEGLTTHHKIPACYKMLCKASSRLLWTSYWTFVFHKRWWVSWI